MSIWRFQVTNEEVIIGNQVRQKITRTGCNEPYRGSYWCPKRQWFQKESCPFANLRECNNFEQMCGAI